MTLAIAPTDHRLTWGGAVSLEHGDGWVMPWRIPHEFPVYQLVVVGVARLTGLSMVNILRIQTLKRAQNHFGFGKD